MLLMLLATCLPGVAHALGENSLKAQAAEAAAADADVADADAADVDASTRSKAPPRRASAKHVPASNLFGERSDEELTVLAANWDALDQHERRALLTEMKRRMARKGDHSGVIRIRTERRYGRLIRQPDGRVIRIETQVVHVRPLDEDDIEAPAREGYGVGFERRVARRGEAEADNQRAPVQGEREASTLLEALAPLPPPPLLDPLPVYRVNDPAP
jgi:hypothetical protein